MMVIVYFKEFSMTLKTYLRKFLMMNGVSRVFRGCFTTCITVVALRLAWRKHLLRPVPVLVVFGRDIPTPRFRQSCKKYKDFFMISYSQILQQSEQLFIRQYRCDKPMNSSK